MIKNPLRGAAGKMALPLAALTQAVLLTMAPSTATAHGSMVDPPSREYACRNLDSPWADPKHDGCGIIKDFVGSWQSNAILGVRSNHKEFIRDGLLCAGGKEGWKELDANHQWPSSVVTPDANGNVQFKYLQTASHKSSYFKTYITKDSYDPKRGLRWDDLELIGETGALPSPGDNTITPLDVKIPAHFTGKRVIYSVWQRDPAENPEGFYACSNVEVMPANVQWQASGALQGSQVSTGSTMTLRVFDQRKHGDLESHSIVVKAGQEQAAQWIYALAKEVNNKSSVIRVGKLEANGQVAPQQSDSANQVYGLNKKVGFAIDQKVPVPVDPPPVVVNPPKAELTGPASAKAGERVSLSAQGSNNGGGTLKYQWTAPAGITASALNQASLSFTAPALAQDKSYSFTVKVTNEKGSSNATHSVLVKKQEQTGGGSDGGNTGGDNGGNTGGDNGGNTGGDNGGSTGQYPAYKEGSTYAAGERVTNGGKVYECKIWPFTAWCSHSPAYYAPGKGMAWQQAWDLVK
ncbi:lytic polysaccharide monooxygenase [Achromobacter piechaudii]|uniref:GlcNAc-binding protein A n=2 Tax=Achromobacter piechaudii TaxID=72556 RepID=A0A6S7E9T3_9BURK|nr:lytic polysaccharide monooxygenase [Achromobacter piechaudii]CAB3713519.1 GlcNAc-binding protein A [Achromobacter piechaudii]CAB3880014.1 GlcNAc-binding protein A [Achromobacter piechaudii]CAB3902790.1 GlcNAc-binding protein A [Achromobacter piechaudii]